MNNYDDLAARAEAGQLVLRPGTTLRGKAAAEAGQRALMEATGADTITAATAIALGRPRLTAAAPSGVTWKVRTTPDLDREARSAAAAQGVSISQLVRDAVAAHVDDLNLNEVAPKHR
jgi:predicted HicB family RNase H-like nuclease